METMSRMVVNRVMVIVVVGKVVGRKSYSAVECVWNDEYTFTLSLHCVSRSVWTLLFRHGGCCKWLRWRYIYAVETVGSPGLVSVQRQKRLKTHTTRSTPYYG